MGCYRLETQGKTLEGFTRKQVASKLMQKNVNEKIVRKILSGDVLIIKDNLEKDQAKKLKTQFINLGLNVYIRNNEISLPDSHLNQNFVTQISDSKTPIVLNNPKDSPNKDNKAKIIKSKPKFKKIMQGVAALLTLLAIIDFAGMFLGYDITGISKSPIFFMSIAGILMYVSRDKLKINDKGILFSKHVNIRNEKGETDNSLNGKLVLSSNGIFFDYSFSNKNIQLPIEDIKDIRVPRAKGMWQDLIIASKDGEIYTFAIIRIFGKKIVNAVTEFKRNLV